MSSSLPYTTRTLHAPGRPRRFTGRALREIAFPIGGLGAGSVSLGGRGQLCAWNLPDRTDGGMALPYPFFALRAHAEGGAPVARVLEARCRPPYRDGVPGLPRLRDARFTGAYPFARIDFQDDVLPVTVALEAFNPFIPTNAGDSGLPVAIFLWTLTNPSGVPVDVTLACSRYDPAGRDGGTPSNGNLNEFVRHPSMAGLRVTGAGRPPAHPASGSLALVSPHQAVTCLTSFWDDFAFDSLLAGGPEPVPEREANGGTLGLTAAIPPGEEVKLPFIFAWHFPNRSGGGRGEDTGYAARFPDAWAVAEYAVRERDRLEAETRLYRDTLFESTAPWYVLEAASHRADVEAYRVAARMIEEGAVEEGLALVKEVRARYDGERRNPWEDAGYSLHPACTAPGGSILLALSGYCYSAPEQRLGLAPRRRPERFRCPFITEQGWGRYTQRSIRYGQRHRLEVRYGRLTVRHLSFGIMGDPPAEAPEALIRMPRREVFAVASREGGMIAIPLFAPITVHAGGYLEVELKWKRGGAGHTA